MSEYSTSFQRHGAYSFDVSTIEDLCLIARTFAGEDPEITVELEDSHRIQGKVLKDLFNDLYVKNMMIVRIMIDASHWEKGDTKRISIALSRGREMPIAVQISGERNPSIKARTDIENIITGKRLWYSLHGVPEMWAAIATTLVEVSLAILIVWSTLRLISSKMDSGSFVLAAWLGSSFLSLLIFRVTPRLFPKMLFDVGCSAKLEQSASYWRSIAFVVVALGLIINLLSSFIMNRVQ